MEYTVTLTSAQDKALSWVAASQQDWISHVVHERCRLATEELVKICVEKCLQTNTPIPGSKDEMVELVFAQAWVKTAAEVNAEPRPFPGA